MLKGRDERVSPFKLNEEGVFRMWISILIFFNKEEETIVVSLGSKL